MEYRDESGNLLPSWLRMLPMEPFARYQIIAEAFRLYIESPGSPDIPKDIRTVTQLARLASNAARVMGLEVEPPPVHGSDDDVPRHAQFFTKLNSTVRSQASIKAAEDSVAYLATLDAGIFFSLDEPTTTEVQNLLNTLRDILSNATDLDEKHRLRLLARLESLQRELHKTTSDLDRLMGFAIECITVAKTAATTGKEIADVGYKLARIGLIVKATTFGLPEATDTDLFLPPAATKEIDLPDNSSSTSP